jgi:hypothetical protein
LAKADEHRSGKSNRYIRVRKKLCHYVAGTTLDLHLVDEQAERLVAELGSIIEG